MIKRIFYVDNIEGNDLNSGITKEKALKSIEKVNSILLSPGDEVRFKCGGTWQGMLQPKGNGEKYAPIRISSYGEGEKAEIDGAGAYAGILLDGVSNYKAVFMHNYYEACQCPLDNERLSKVEINIWDLLVHPKDGKDWLQDKWDLLCKFARG